MELWKHLLADTTGVTSIEYALLALLIFCAIIGAVTLVGEQTAAFYFSIADLLSSL
jgi:Flp pilus assembly pilin Flp